MSELLYAALAVGALLCLDLSERAPRRWPLLVTAGVLTGLAVLTPQHWGDPRRRRRVDPPRAPPLAGRPRSSGRRVALCVGPWVLWQSWAASANGALQTTGFTGPDLGLWAVDP